MAATTRRFVPRRRHAGLLLMLVGATSVIAGLVETTVSSAVSQNCPAGAALLAKFQFSGSQYDFVGPDANRNVMTVEDGSGAGANWHSTIAVSSVVIAGGPGAITTSLSPMLYASRVSNAGLPRTDGTTPDIAGVQFCRPDTSTTTSAADADAGTGATTVDPGSSTTDSTASSTSTSTGGSASTPPAADPSTTATPTPSTRITTATIAAPVTAATLPAMPVTNPGAIAAHAVPMPTPTPATTAVKDTVPAPAPTIAGATTTTTVNPFTTGSTIPTTISPGGATSTSVYAVLASLPTARLPRTGSSSSPLIAIGIVLLGAGLGITVVGARRERGRA